MFMYVSQKLRSLQVLWLISLKTVAVLNDQKKSVITLHRKIFSQCIKYGTKTAMTKLIFEMVLLGHFKAFQLESLGAIAGLINSIL